jgi:hypothetical protein
MKIIFTILILFFSILSSNAQYYYLPFPNAGQNPGNLNSDLEFTVGAGQAAGWKTVLGPSNSSPTWSLADTIPFPFLFNGNPFTEYIVSSSGILSFDIFTSLPAPSYTKSTFPNASIPDYSIGIWGLNGKGFNDYITSKTFGTSPNRQHWIQFCSYGYGTVISDGSNYTFWSIVFEETSNHIYVVDARTAGYAATNLVSIGVQVDVNTAFSVQGSPSVVSLAGTDPSPSNNSFYQFIQGTQANFDLSVTGISSSLYLSPGSNSIAGSLINYGTDTITSLKINYTVNGGALSTALLTGLSIPRYESYEFIHPNLWNSSTSGAYTITCFASDLNGTQADQNPANDSLSKVVNVLASFEQRIPFFEIFTSSTCPPCKPGNENFHGIIDTIPASKLVSIKYQQDFPGTGDPYSTVETLNRRTNYYAINNIPRMEIDGGWDENANSFVYNDYKESRKKPASYKLSGSFTADTLTKTFSSKVKYAPLYQSSGAKLALALIEKTTQLNVKSNGENKFFNVVKKMLPDETGTLLASSAAGVWDSVTTIYSFAGNYRLPSNGQLANLIDLATEHSVEQFSDITIIAWIQSNDGSKYVHQSANLTKDNQIGIYSLNKSIASISIFPNPAQNFAKVEITLSAPERIKLILSDSEGKWIEVKTENAASGKLVSEFDLSKLAAGIYHIAVSDSKNNTFVRRISLVK